MNDSIISLRCEGRINPLGIDTFVPKFSYQLFSSRVGLTQSARCIQVSTDESFAVGTCWDTGRVDSTETIHIPYEGTPLCSKTRYFWRVKVWNEKDETVEWSPVQWWETGFMGESWQGKWIEPEQEDAIKDPPGTLEMALTPYPIMSYEDTLRPPRYLRKEFFLKKPIVKARLYATAHGVYRMELNGRRVGDRALAPEITPYPKLLQYQTYDVTACLKEGANAWGAVIADGWWIGRIGFMSDSCQYGNRLAFLGQLEITTDDGTKEVIGTDESFTSNTGGYVYSDLFIGEKYDSRKEPKGWSKTGFDDTSWPAVKEIAENYSNLEGQTTEKVCEVETLLAKKVIKTPKGETVIDFGQAISGRVRMTVKGNAGDVVSLEHSETLDKEGNFLRNIHGRSKDQRDIYILHSSDTERYEPDFTYHGFRYVKVDGYPGEVKLENFKAVVLGTELTTTGSFTCDREDINQLQRNIFRSQQGNMLAIPTDCPTREKSGFTGDLQIYAATGCFNMDLDNFLSFWLRQARLEQSPEGVIPFIIPNFPDDGANTDPSGMMKTSSAWGDAITIAPMTLYEYYGDISVIEDNYEAMKAWVDYIKDYAPGDVWSEGHHFGDWNIPSLTSMAGGMQKAVAETASPVATSYYAFSARNMADAAKLLGKQTDFEKYTALYERIRKAYWNTFGSENGKLRSHYQGIYALALQFNLVPENMREKVSLQLVKRIEEQGNRLDTGFTSVRFLLPVLYKSGQKETAKKILFQTQCPSWLYEVNQGATTIWERWDAIKPDGTRTLCSYNHYAFGCVGEFLYRYIAGLKPLEPGFSYFELSPDVEFGLDSVALIYDSIHGKIALSFEKKDGNLSVKATIPANTRARIKLPKAGKEAIRALGLSGIASIVQKDGYTELEVLSGCYSVRYKY